MKKREQKLSQKSSISIAIMLERNSKLTEFIFVFSMYISICFNSMTVVYKYV